jgi:hypothetical protein
MPIVPDTKDWTWVLERSCPECGYDAVTTTRAAAPRLIQDNAAAWQAALSSREAAALRTRPREDRWSAAEYACHVRDVYRIFDQRLLMMLEADDPTFPNWDQDATAAADGYQDQEHRLPQRRRTLQRGQLRQVPDSRSRPPPARRRRLTAAASISTTSPWMRRGAPFAGAWMYRLTCWRLPGGTSMKIIPGLTALARAVAVTSCTAGRLRHTADRGREVAVRTRAGPRQSAPRRR